MKLSCRYPSLNARRAPRDVAAIVDVVEDPLDGPRTTQQWRRRVVYDRGC